MPETNPSPVKTNKNLYDHFDVPHNNRRIQPCRDNLRKCGPPCNLCDHVAGTYEFESTVTSRKYQVIDRGENLSCDTNNVIYLVTCTCCGIQYVGKTTTALNRRWTTNFGDARRFVEDNNCKVSCQLLIFHFWGKSGCFANNLRIQPIEVVKDIIEGCKSLEESLRAREKFWTETLRTYFPFGLNKVPVVKGQVVAESGVVEKLFTPMLPRSSRVRGKRGNKNESPNGITLYNTMVTIVSNNDRYGWIGKIRKLINAQKNKALVALAKLVHQKVLSVTNPRMRHLVLLCIELLGTRLVKNVPPPEKRTPPELIWSLPFLNQGASYLGLGKILRDTALCQSLEKKLPMGTNIIWPTIVWKYSEPIRNKIFNYSNTVAGIDWNNIRNMDGICDCSCDSSSFCNRDLGHIITGDLSFVKNSKLRRLLSLGPKFRDPPKVDFSSLENSILESVDGLVEQWARKLTCPEELWDDWKARFGEVLRTRTNKLKKKRWKLPLPGLDDVEIRRELDILHEHFVLIPADKAESNVIIVCKKFFVRRIIRELSQEDGAYEEVIVRKEDIQRWAKECEEKFEIEVPKEQERCSSFYWTAKMHKVITAMRFLAASHRCFTKGLSKKLTGLLKGVLKVVRLISSLRKRDTGADHCWIIENSKPVLDRIQQINARGDFQTLDIFDFKDLYTKIPHPDLKQQLRFVISLAFDSEESEHGNTVLCGAGRSVGAVFKNGSMLDDKEKRNAISKHKLIEMVDFLIDHIFIKVGSKTFRQKVGIPMGTDCGPMLANLYLFGCEYRWLSKKWSKLDLDGNEKDAHTFKTDRKLVTAFAHCFRYIDDLVTFNNRNVLSQISREMYPFLTLEKQNKSTVTGDFLDLRFNIRSGILSKSLYDKRDAFGFDIVAFPNLLSNVHFCSSHGVFVSQLVRFSRICDEFQDFATRAKKLFDRLVNQGFSAKILRNKVEKFFQNYRRSLVKFSLANVGLLMEIF